VPSPTDASRLHAASSDYMAALRLLVEAEQTLKTLLPGVPREMLMTLASDLSDPTTGVEKALEVLRVVNKYEAPPPSELPPPPEVDEDTAIPKDPVVPKIEQPKIESVAERRRRTEAGQVLANLEPKNVQAFLKGRDSFHTRELLQFLGTSCQNLLRDLRQQHRIEKDPNDDWGWIVLLDSK
jgi:hypothetical protein